jgi:hypothetical protein
MHNTLFVACFKFHGLKLLQAVRQVRNSPKR